MVALGSVIGSLATIVYFLIAPHLSAEHAAPGFQALVVRAAGGLCIVLVVLVGAVLLHERSPATPLAPLPSEGLIPLEDAPEVLSPRWV